MSKANSDKHFTKSKIIKPEDMKLEDLQHLSQDSFPLWALSSGAKVDNRNFDLEKFRHLIPIYADSSDMLVIAKAAQMGLSVYSLLRTAYLADCMDGINAAIYYPNQSLAEDIAKIRLTPILESMPHIKAKMGESSKLSHRKIGNSSYYMFYLGGKSSKDSVPLDVLCVDEVRLCADKDIDQTKERISASPHKIQFYLSTVGLPDTNIDRMYKYGRQLVYFSKCGCNSLLGDGGCDIARAFPDSIVADDPRRPGEVYIRCPKCKWEIKNPQNGRFVPQNPGASYNSYHIHQLLSAFMTPRLLWDAFNTTTNIQEFYNAKLGLPYVNESNKGVSMTQLESCINTDLVWAKNQVGGMPKTAMGVDQGMGYLYVTIATIKDGKKKLLHVEVIESKNPDYKVDGQQVSPFNRLSELMEAYNVRYCVIDAFPNTNDSIEFARKYHGRAYLALYQGGKDVVQWMDKPNARSVQKSGPLLNFKYWASINRYSSFDFLFGEIKGGSWQFPHPDALMQRMFDKNGILTGDSPCRRLFVHLTRLVKDRKMNEETGEETWRWVFAGGASNDPHAAHSLNYCNVALERLKTQPIWTFA